jgi:thymidine phosphorylase
VNCLPLIEAKRDGGVLSAEEIQRVISSFTRGEIPDYQMAALLMAIYFRGLNADETRALTLAMRDSGETLKFPDDPRPLVDKHSTGGIGDKVSLPLAPLLACLGFRVPMISGSRTRHHRRNARQARINSRLSTLNSHRPKS